MMNLERYLGSHSFSRNSEYTSIATHISAPPGCTSATIISNTYQAAHHRQIIIDLNHTLQQNSSMPWQSDIDVFGTSTGVSAEQGFIKTGGAVMQVPLRAAHVLFGLQHICPSKGMQPVLHDTAPGGQPPNIGVVRTQSFTAGGASTQQTSPTPHAPLP